MTEVDNQDAAGADVCKIVGLAFRCERKATGGILKDLQQLRDGAGTPATVSAARTERLDGAIQRGAEYRSCTRSTFPPAPPDAFNRLSSLDSSFIKAGHAKSRTRGSFTASSI
jgi:hypothetical protein